MTQIEQLISKIEEKLRGYKTALENTSYMTGQYVGLQAKIALCEELLEAAKTILKEPASEDLEKELKHYCNDYYNCDYPKQLEEENCSEVMPHIVSAAKHFAQWQKEQMMKDAIEGKVVAVKTTMSDRPHTYPWIEVETHLYKNDKVKVIILPGDNKND